MPRAAAGCTLIFINADEADWPKMLYDRMGFTRLATFDQFLKEPGKG